MKAGNDYGISFIKIKPGTETASLKYIEQTFKKLFPVSPYSYTFKADENYKNYEAEAKMETDHVVQCHSYHFYFMYWFVWIISIICRKRTKEIGIRKVLGASVNNVVTILSKDFVKLVIMALLIAIPLAWMAANKWLENYPYRISLSWQIFAIAGVLVIFIALATVSFQAIRAALANPIKSSL